MKKILVFCLFLFLGIFISGCGDEINNYYVTSTPIPNPTPNPSPTPEPEPTPIPAGNLKGSLFSGELPCDNVDVTISGPVTMVITSDLEGNFSFPELPYGEYTLSVSSPFYSDFSQSVTISATSTILPPVALTPVNLNRCFGGSSDDYGNSIAVSSNGTVWIAGSTQSAAGYDIKNRHGARENNDLWLLGINPKSNEIVYNRCFGGTGYDYGDSIAISPDGKTVWVAGATNSPVGCDIKEKSGNTGGYDLWLLGINAEENDGAEPVYNRRFGGSNNDYGHAVCISPDGETVWVTGETSSLIDGFDIKNRWSDGGNPVNNDLWLLGIDARQSDNVEPIYNRCFGGYDHKDDSGSSVYVSPDGGTVWVTGYTKSGTGGDVFNRRGQTNDSDLWLLGIDPNDENWATIPPKYSRCFGGWGEKDDEGHSVCVSQDSSMVWVTGYTKSNVGDGTYSDVKNRFGNNDSDLWVLGIDPQGEQDFVNPSNDTQILYNRCFGGWGYKDDSGNFVRLSPDGKTVWVTGVTKSDNGGDVQNRPGSGDINDLWVIGIDAAQNEAAELKYNRVFGGMLSDAGNSIFFQNGKTVWIAGNTESTEGGDVPAKRGSTDLWLFGIDVSQ